MKQMQYRAPKHKPIDTLHSIIRRGNFIRKILAYFQVCMGANKGHV